MPSAEVGSAYATLGLDDSKLDSGLSSAKSKFSSAVDAMEGKAKSAGSAIGSALATGVTAAGVALAGVATVGVKSYMDIESAAADAASKMDLSAIAEKSGQTTSQAFDAVKEHVMGLADELGQLNTNAFDPTQIAQACANLAAQGFDVATASAEDLAPVLALATATNYDLGDSADMALAAMNTFGMGIEDLGHIADVYTTACGASAAGMGDLNYAMQQAGPVASVANVSFETLTACLETFSQSNIKGEKAGTALRGAINTLITPTKSLTDGLASIGLSMDQVDPRSNDFVDVLKKMKTQADASGQGLSAFTSIFGAEGGLIYKLASSTDTIEEFRNGLLNCNDAAVEMAKNMLDNLGGSFDAAMGAASSLAYLIGGKLAPSLKAAFDWFSSTGAPAIREFITAISDGDWASVGDQIAAGVEAGWAKLKDLGGQLFGWIKNVDWGALGDYVTKGISAAWDELKSLGSDLLDALLDVDWGGVGSAMLDAISTAIDSIIDYAGGIYDYFTDIDWGNVWDALVAAWDSAIGTLSDVGSTVLGYFTSVDWGTVGFKLGQAIRDAITKLADIGQTVWNYLTSADWSGAGSSITEKIRAGLETLSDAWEDFKAGLLTVDWLGAAGEIADKLKAGFKQVTDWAADIIAGVKKDWDDWISSGGPKTLGEDLAKAVVEGARDLGEWIYDKVEDFWNGIKGDGGSLGTTIYTAFKNIFTTLIDWAKLALTAAYDFVVGFANTILTAGKGTIGAAILEIIGGAMNSAWDGAGDSLIEKAAGWREDAESIFSSEDFDVDVATTYTGAGNPKDLDGSTISVNVNYTSTSGKSLAAKTSPEGGASVIPMGSGENRALYVNLAGGGSMKATEWARELGKAGNSYADVLAQVNAMRTEGTALLPKTIESIMAAFTEGQKEYEEANQTAGENLVEASEEAAENTVVASEEAASTTTEAATAAATTTTQAATAQADAISAAGAAAAEKILIGSQTAANAIALGGQTSANFATAGGQSVKIGLDSAGNEIAVIGQVAQQRITAAGGDLYSKVVVAGSDLQAKASVAGSSLQTSSALAGLTLVSGGTSLSNSLQSGGTAVYGSMANGASAINSASSNLNSAAAAVGAAAAKVTGGTLSWSGTASTTKSTTGTFDDPWMNAAKGTSTKGYATGTKTTGPELAVIGEDGPENPEFVIPTKKKRWDLLYAAMRAYGIPGYAEGTSTGADSSDEGEAKNMTATFGITGLAEMASSVKRILNNLKDFFRITWDVIKSEGATYWKSIDKVITANVTAMRDSVWASLIDIRNTAISSNADILTSTKTAWDGYLTTITPSLTSVKEGIVSSFDSAATGAKTAIDTMITNSTASLQAFRVKWQEIWTGLVTDMTTAQTSITAGVTAIAEQLKKISVSVNITSSSGGSGSSSSGSGYTTTGVSASGLGEGNSNFTINPDGSASFVHETLTGPVLTNALKYTSPSGVISYINPLNNQVIQTMNPVTTTTTGGGGGGSTNYPAGNYAASAATGWKFSVGGYTYILPSVFRAAGTKTAGPEFAMIGEDGPSYPEYVIPTKTKRWDLLNAAMHDYGVPGYAGGMPELVRPAVSRPALSLAEAGLGAGASPKIVIEDRTEHHWYLDGKEVTNLVMERAKKQLQLRGAISAR